MATPTAAPTMATTAATATASSSSPASSAPPGAASSGDEAAFRWPREYHFPAFFTRQTNLTTQHAQLTKWSALVLAYARHHRIFKLSVSAASSSDLFCNRRIDRRLAVEDIREVFDFMRRDGRAEFVGGGASSSASGSGSASTAAAAANSGDVVYVYWRKPQEWAAIVESFVEDTGQKGSVLTVYELTEGEGTRGTELHGMDTEVLRKALAVLVKRGKAQVFGQEDSQGVKFF